MVGLYEKDLPKLKKHGKGWPKPDYLRSIAKQGRHGAAPLQGYSESTEGSNWIIQCARKADKRPLYILVWGGLDDVAQALHDAPEIAAKVRINWIGGPNKKWSLPSYCYIIENFPDLWFIEDNASYRGFIADYKNPDKHHAGFYDYYVKGCGNLGADFYNYKEGLPKLGDTPTLLYMLDGDAAVPERESWGGSFEKCAYSSRVVFDRPTTSCDTIQRDGIIEWRFRGPVLKKGEGKVTNSPWSSGADNEVGILTVDKQQWPVYYLGDGNYMARYATYKTGIISYTISSDIKGFPLQSGYFFVENVFPGKHRSSDYKVGATWWTDRHDPSLYSGKQKCQLTPNREQTSSLDLPKCEGRRTGIQGALTVEKWRDAIMEDWGKRCQWLK